MSKSAAHFRHMRVHLHARILPNRGRAHSQSVATGSARCAARGYRCCLNCCEVSTWAVGGLTRLADEMTAAVNGPTNAMPINVKP